MSTNYSAKVSILLPSHKDAPMIDRAIMSVISQSYQEWELIIIDDGLSQAARSVVDQYASSDPRIIILSHKGNIGIQKSLNQGIQSARGIYIARIDDDDRWIDNAKLADQISYFENNPSCVLLGTNAIITNEHGHVFETYTLRTTDEEIRLHMLIKNCFLHPTIMARKAAVDEAGGYDEHSQVQHIEDYALWLRLGQLGTVANLDTITAELTVHDDSVTFQNRIIQTKRIRTLIQKYKDVYPNFHQANRILLLRLIGFTVLKYVPLPQRMLYRIQKIYKES